MSFEARKVVERPGSCHDVVLAVVLGTASAWHMIVADFPDKEGKGFRRRSARHQYRESPMLPIADAG